MQSDILVRGPVILCPLFQFETRSSVVEKEIRSNIRSTVHREDWVSSTARWPQILLALKSGLRKLVLVSHSFATGMYCISVSGIHV